MSAYFYLIVGIAATAGIGFSVITRGLLYHTPDTDNELMAYAAAQSHKWRRLSDIHKYGAGKTSMKDMVIILLALCQKIMGDRESDHPYVTLAGFAISASTVLLYLIGTNYWGPTIGLFISLLYLFSFWPWQIALHGGHINIANTFFLLSIYLIQRSSVDHLDLYLALSGVIFCWTMFSSASAMRYLVPFFAGLFYSEYNLLISRHDYAGLYKALPLHNLIKYDLAILVIVITATVIVFLSYKNTVRNMYYNKASKFLHGIIKGQNSFSLDYYIKHANTKLKKYIKASIWFIGAIMIIFNTINFSYVWPMLLGFIGMIVLFTLPDVKGGIIRYFLYPLEAQRKTHFRVYVDYFAKKGITVYRNTRGAGWSWVPKVFWRLAPFHMVVFVASFTGLLILRITNNQVYFLPIDLMILIISTSSIWWAELTKAPQISRAYSPALITSLLFVGYSFYIFSNYNYLLPVIIGVLAPIIIWNFWIFLSDVYPARMGATTMLKTIKHLNIKEIYTYNTKYNRSMVETIPGLGESAYTPRRKIEPPLAVHYIDSMAIVRDGWIVIPGTNGKSITMIGESETLNGNFNYTKDPVLNKLIESKNIEKVATAKIKTHGTSRIWPLESEVFGYIDLILHEIKPKDLYRGYAWLINSKNLKSL